MDEQKIIATNLAKNYVIKESALFGRKKKIVSRGKGYHFGNSKRANHRRSRN